MTGTKKKFLHSANKTNFLHTANKITGLVHAGKHEGLKPCQTFAGFTANMASFLREEIQAAVREELSRVISSTGTVATLIRRLLHQQHQGCLPFTKTIRLEISGISIKQLNAKLREWVSL